MKNARDVGIKQVLTLPDSLLAPMLTDATIDVVGLRQRAGREAELLRGGARGCSRLLATRGARRDDKPGEDGGTQHVVLCSGGPGGFAFPSKHQDNSGSGMAWRDQATAEPPSQAPSREISVAAGTARHIE